VSILPLQVMKNVEYPATLEISPAHLSDELRAKEPGHVCYQLQAVVLHHGKKATGGHYTAFTLDVQRHAAAVVAEGAMGLRDTKVWRSVNDAKVGVVNESQVLGAQDSAYILFYGRIRD
jgi:ubiquitin C-terminal hydrolase